MRRERLYLSDIVEAADHIAEFIAGFDFEAFEKSELIRSAVVQKLSIIGEDASRISPEFRGRNAQVPWPQIKELRDTLIHGYYSTAWQEVWQAATDRCPVLREQVAAILTAEFGAPEQQT